MHVFVCLLLVHVRVLFAVICLWVDAWFATFLIYMDCRLMAVLKNKIKRDRERGGSVCVYIYTDEYMNACMYIYNTHDAHTHTHLNTHSRRWTGQGEVRRPRCRTFEAWGTNQEFCSLRNVVRCESTQVLRC